MYRGDAGNIRTRGRGDRLASHERPIATESLVRRFTLAPIAALLLAATTLPAQDTARAVTAGDKSPMAARVIGILPGAGHIYAGETTRGFAFMGGMLGVGVLGTLMFIGECIGAIGETCGSKSTENLVTAAIFGVWGWSIYDAGLAAHRTNARRRYRVSLIIGPVRSTAAHAPRGRTLKLGLAVATR